MAHPHFTRFPAVEGYCFPQSYLPGEHIEVRCASRVESFSAAVSLVRADRTTVWTQQRLRAGDHLAADQAWADGCDWPTTFTIDTDPSWPSGYYEIEMRADGVDPGSADATAHAFFVLRPPPRPLPGRPLLVLSTNTYNAYNQWGGRCLYSGAARVSFARPLERGYLRRPAAPFETDFDGRVANIAEPSDPEHRRLTEYQAAHHYPLWTASSGWHNWERRFMRWASEANIELDVAINSDLEFHPDVLEGCQLMLSVGHDEYWSWGMRDTVDDFVDRGGNWAIFSGNTSFWQVRYENEGRTMVCHKGRARVDDPVLGTDQRHRLTSMWSDPLIGRPETRSIGLTFSRGGYHRVGQGVPRGSGAYTVHRPEHWAFADTGLRAGDQLGAGSFIVGYEVDGCAFTTVDGLPRPTHEDDAPADLEILGTCPARLLSITDEVCEAPAALWASVEPPGDLEGVAMVLFGDDSPQSIAKVAHGRAMMASFSRGRGTVFNAGSADWAYGLDDDPLVQQVTANVLRQLSAR